MIMPWFRCFDKDEDGKLSADELREIMVQIGDNPVSEEEFEHFLTVIPRNDVDCFH